MNVQVKHESLSMSEPGTIIVASGVKYRTETVQRKDGRVMKLFFDAETGKLLEQRDVTPQKIEGMSAKDCYDAMLASANEQVADLMHMPNPAMFGKTGAPVPTLREALDAIHNGPSKQELQRLAHNARVIAIYQFRIAAVTFVATGIFFAKKLGHTVAAIFRSYRTRK